MIDEKFYDFNPNIKKVIASNIRKYRKLRGLTQEQLALLTELSYDFIRRIETSEGKSGFSVVTLYKIATVLEVPLDYLTQDEENKTEKRITILNKEKNEKKVYYVSCEKNYKNVSIDEHYDIILINDSKLAINLIDELKGIIVLNAKENDEETLKLMQK